MKARHSRKLERGATAIEYGLIAALMTIVMLVGLSNFGNSTVNMYGNISNRVLSAGR